MRNKKFYTIKFNTNKNIVSNTPLNAMFSPCNFTRSSLDDVIFLNPQSLTPSLGDQAFGGCSQESGGSTPPLGKIPVWRNPCMHVTNKQQES